MSSESARRRLLLLLIPYLFLVAVKLALSWGLDNPLKPDEVVYLGSARYLATGEGLTDAAGRHAYKIGYSLALTPAFWLADDPVGGFKAAQGINALLLSLVYPLGFLLVGRLAPELRDRDRALLAFCVSCYPAAILYATTAMSANLFLPAFFVFLLTGLSALEGTRPFPWLAFALATALLYTTHERALGLVLVAFGVSAAHFWWGRGDRRLGGIFLLAAPFFWWLLSLAEVPGSRWHTKSQSLTVLEGVLKNPGKLLVTFSGHLEYLAFSTFGVLVLGTVLWWMGWRRLARDWPVPVLFWPLLYGSAASIFAISVLFNVVRWPVERFTQWVYGRHNEMVLLPLVLVALLALRRVEGKENRRLLLGLSAGLGALVVFLTAILWAFWTPQVGPPFHFCATSVALYMVVLHAVGGKGTLILMALGFMALVACFSHRWQRGVACLTLLFVIATSATYGDGWRRRYEETEGQRELVRRVQRVEEVQVPRNRTILRHREGKIFHFHYFNLSYFLPEYTFRGLRPQARRQRGELVLASHLDLSEIQPGARLVGLENFTVRRGYIQSLWVLPGSLQKVLASRGWLLPKGFPSAFEPRHLEAEWSLGKAGDLEVESRRWFEVPLRLVHRGRFPWPHRGGMGQEEYSVRIQAAWLDERGEVVAESWRDLPRMLYPGDEETWVLRLRAETDPGRHRLRLTLAQDLGDEGSISGTQSLDVAVTVTGDGP